MNAKLTMMGLMALSACAPDDGPQGVGAQLQPAAYQADNSRSDNFDRGLCVSPCPGAAWQVTQEIEGKVVVRDGRLISTAGPRRGKVPKAGLIARTAPVEAGKTVVIGFDLMIPSGRPANSIHLVDLECASCLQPGNPGIRLYLRHGRLRIDRSKIGIEHAWTNDSAPAVQPGRWHRIEYHVTFGKADEGRAAVYLDGELVLNGQGRTLPSGIRTHVDRLQFGITANSNDVTAVAMFDNFSAELID